MTSDPLRDLLAQDKDEAVPPTIERALRSALASQLEAGRPSTTAPDPKPGSTGASDTVNLARSAAAWKLVTVALVGVGAGAAGFAAGRATAPHDVANAPAMTVTAPATASTLPTAMASSAPPRAAASEPAASSAPASSAIAFGPKPAASDLVDPWARDDREQSLLERARSALLRHDANAAEDAVNTARKEFPTSRHAEEREVIEIQVLRERGENAAAKERAAAFLTKYPHSLFRARIERLATEN